MKNSASFTSTPIPPKDGLKIIASVIALFQPVADAINPPLRFALKLDPTHPYLTERVSKAIIEAFGLGLCSKGSMAGRIAIPIRNEKGELVAYAGRWPGDDWPEGEDKYKLPTGFQKHRVLFNLDRVLDAEHLVIVEGYFGVFRLYEAGIPAVALMGSSLAPEQVEGLLQRTVRYRIQKYYKEAGIRKKASVHTLRHTFATHQIHNGLKINQLKDVLGHKKMETTYKYVHLDRTNLRREMEAGAL